MTRGDMRPAVALKPRSTWRSRFGLGYSQTLGDLVTFNVGAEISGNAISDGTFFSSERSKSDLALSLGAVTVRGAQRQPLIQVHLGDGVSLDGWASLRIGREGTTETYLLGATFSF